MTFNAGFPGAVGAGKIAVKIAGKLMGEIPTHCKPYAFVFYHLLAGILLIPAFLNL